MPPLTGVRAHAGRVAGVPTTSRTRATRVRTRGAPPARQVTGWPELLTELTCWWHTGEPYQVPIEPVAAGHALVGIQGPTQASIEYMGGALELIASLMGMVQRREALLSLYGIQIPPVPMAPAAVTVLAPTAPPLAAGRREGQAPARDRGRARGTRVESCPSEPILSDDDAETSDSEEASSQHSDSSESRSDDAGLGSENGGRR